MNKDEFFRNLGDRKLFEGRKEQIKQWSEMFQIRSNSHGYYVAWKGTTRQVEGTTMFDSWSDAKLELATNWKRYLDEEFEREVLTKED